MISADGGLRGVLRKGLLRQGFILTPIETGATSSGVGDIYWTCAKARASGWIECKATDGWAVTFRPHQLGFVQRALACGDRSVVAVRARGQGSGGGLGDALWLLHGRCAGLVAAEGLRAVPPADLLYRQYGFERTWDWLTIARVLLV